MRINFGGGAIPACSTWLVFYFSWPFDAEPASTMCAWAYSLLEFGALQGQAALELHPQPL